MVPVDMGAIIKFSYLPIGALVASNSTPAPQRRTKRQAQLPDLLHLFVSEPHCQLDLLSRSAFGLLYDAEFSTGRTYVSNSLRDM